MKFKKYSDHLNRKQAVVEAAAMRVNEDFTSVVKELENDFESLKKVIKGSSISAFEVWLELGVKAGAIGQEEAQKLMATHESIDEAADNAATEIAPEEMDAFEKELEKALKSVLQEVPADLKKIADGGEIDLAPKLDAEAQKELNEAIGLLVGGGLALPAITQILGKSIAWAGGKIGSGDMKQFGEKTQELGDKLHHKYEHVLDKILSPFTKNMDEKKRHVVNKVVFYSILAVVGGVGIGGAVHAAGSGAHALAAAEGGLSAIKAGEIAAGAAELLPAILSKIVQSA